MSPNSKLKNQDIDNSIKNFTLKNSAFKNIAKKSKKSFPTHKHRRTTFSNPRKMENVSNLLSI